MRVVLAGCMAAACTSWVHAQSLPQEQYKRLLGRALAGFRARDLQGGQGGTATFRPVQELVRENRQLR